MPQGWTAIPEPTTPAAPAGWTPVAPVETAATGAVRPIAADEPDTYWHGALKGAKEGVAGGAKGFVEGMAQSPAHFVQGLVSLLTTNPLTTAGETIAAIKRLPESIRQAGGDPEAWGQGVGDVTGQTMIGLAAPAVARGTARGARAVATSPIVQRVAPSLVKHAATAAGAAVAGPAGAIVGAGIGEHIADALRTGAAAAERPAAVGKVVGKAPTVNAAVMDALNELRAAPPGPAGAARLPEYPQAAADTMRRLQERPTVTSARPSPASAPVTAPPVTAPLVVAAPGPRLVASHPPAAPTPTVRNLNDVPAPATVATRFNPTSALRDVKDVFATLDVPPLRAEATNAMELVRRGLSPEDAVARILKTRAPASAGADLAARLAQPSDATMHARVAARNAAGRWTE